MRNAKEDATTDGAVGDYLEAVGTLPYEGFKYTSVTSNHNDSDTQDKADLQACVNSQRSAALESQTVWAEKPLRDRLKIVGRLPGLIARDCKFLAELIERSNSSFADKLSSEIMPLADACHYAARRGRKVLAMRRLPRQDCSNWLGRIDVSVHREPWGLVLIIAPWNYPMFLPGVQVVQAIAAGNAVLVKPAPGCGDVLRYLVKLLIECGMTVGLVQILPSQIESAAEAIEQGVGKVVLTGSSETGRRVSEQLARHLTPATMELSGCDPVFVLPDADLNRVADAIAFGLRLNAGATCIAPRRVFISPRDQEILERLLAERLASCPAQAIHPTAWPTFVAAIRQAIDSGARAVVGAQWLDFNELQSGPLVLASVSTNMQVARQALFAPVLSLIEAADMPAALVLERDCPYSLGASIFGSRERAEYWSRFIEAGCVTINDMIVPTADPRVSFGGRAESGYGVTRGLDGLLEMTRPKVVCTRRGGWLPHLQSQRQQNLEQVLVSLLKLSHGGSLRERISGVANLMKNLWKGFTTRGGD